MCELCTFSQIQSHMGTHKLLSLFIPFSLHNIELQFLYHIVDIIKKVFIFDDICDFVINNYA